MCGDVYADHIRKCNGLAQASPEHFRNMLTFVLATIQQQLESVPDILADFDTLGPESRFAFGSKAKGLEYISRHNAELYADAMRIVRRHVTVECNSIDLLQLFMRVPGIGLVKAGFCAQLFAGRVGCLDVHNLKLYGIPENAVKINKSAKPETVYRKALEYSRLCIELGGPIKLWAKWCEYKASLIPGNWQNGGASVSEMHIEALTRDFRNTIPDLFASVDTEPRFSPNYSGGDKS